MSKLWPTEIGGVWHLAGSSEITYEYRWLIHQLGGVFNQELGPPNAKGKQYKKGYACNSKSHAEQIIQAIREERYGADGKGGAEQQPSNNIATSSTSSKPGFTKCPKCGWEEGISTPKPAAENDEWEARGGAPLPDDDIPF